MMTLTIYTDGGSLNNPGQAASAFVFYIDNKLIFKHSEKIGVASNNFAEYTALVKALGKTKEILNEYSLNNIQVFSDSQLMVNQLNGLYKVKDTNIRGFIMKIRILEADLNIPIKYTHVLREKNQLADSLVKQALGR